MQKVEILVLLFSLAYDDHVCVDASSLSLYPTLASRTIANILPTFHVLFPVNLPHSVTISQDGN